MATVAITQPVIKSILVALIDPNPWNPNRMDEEKFGEYVAEVHRLGRLPKPVVVRKLGDRYQILDGEHGWRAAQEVGLTEILCELVEVDDFTARRETFKRNQRGEHNRVLEGRMFIDMMAMKGLNNCQLADEIGISEGTVRNSLDYAEAADKREAYLAEQGSRNSYESTDGSGQDRNSYELNQARADIAKLSIRRLKIYQSLPEIVHDKWLDAGGHEVLVKPFTGRGLSAMADQLQPIVDHGLTDLVEGSFVSFGSSLSYALNLADWIDSHSTLLDVVQYVRALADHRLGASLLDHLPCQREKNKVKVLISLAEWEEILEDASHHTDDDDDLLAMVDSGIRVELKRKGVDLAKLFGPQVAELLQVLENAPNFIRDADHLTLVEQVALHRFDLETDPDLVEEVKRMAVERLRQRRCGSQANGTQGSPGGDGDVQAVLGQCLNDVREQEILLEENDVLDDRSQLYASVISRIDLDETIKDTTVNGRPASDVLREEVDNLSAPMLALLGSALAPQESAMSPARRWLKARCSSDTQQADAVGV